MLFVVISRLDQWPGNGDQVKDDVVVTLRRNNWNDYGYNTTFDAEIILSGGRRAQLGPVKIIKSGQKIHESTHKKIPNRFSALGDDFCSLGQGVKYYEILKEFGESFVEAFGEAMNDIVIKPDLIPKFENEPALRVSLLRTAEALEAMEKAPAIFGRGQTVMTDVFEVRTRFRGAEDDHRLKFDFRPHSGLPHRIAVLVGLNGVGKTALMARLAFLITRFESASKQRERTATGNTFEELGEITPRPSFYNVIAISFSAFDDFEIPRPTQSDEYSYTYCGLRKIDGGVRTEREIANRVVLLISKMSISQREYFAAVMPQVIGRSDCREFIASPTANRAFYDSLSAGQRIVLNIISELIVSISARSLILLDEPETHLHPQLLSTLLATLSDILKATESVAIVATHSPIVVQQVPSRSVSVIRRVMDRPVVSRPAIECFGENLTEIVRTVFEAVESDRDYEQVIDDLLKHHGNDADAVERLFNGKMGLNARLYLRSRAVH